MSSLCLRLAPSARLQRGLLPKILYVFLVYPLRPTCTAQRNLDYTNSLMCKSLHFISYSSHSVIANFICVSCSYPHTFMSKYSVIYCVLLYYYFVVPFWFGVT